MAPDAGPIEALARITAERLSAFGREHPAEALAAVNDGTTFAAAASDLRATLPRLVWNMTLRTPRAAVPEPWLRLTLVRIEETLVKREAGALIAAAPETGVENAAALARLPSGFAGRIVLDMVLETREDERLLIGSLPDEGGVYLLVHCRIEGEACALRRFVLVSVPG